MKVLESVIRILVGMLDKRVLFLPPKPPETTGSLCSNCQRPMVVAVADLNKTNICITCRARVALNPNNATTRKAIEVADRLHPQIHLDMEKGKYN